MTLANTSGLKTTKRSLNLTSNLFQTSTRSPGLLKRKYKDDISFDNDTYIVPQNNEFWVVWRIEPHKFPHPQRNIWVAIVTWIPSAIESRINEIRLINSFWYGSILPTTLLPLISTILWVLKKTTLLLRLSKYVVLRGQYPLVEKGISTTLWGRWTGSPVK